MAHLDAIEQKLKSDLDDARLKYDRANQEFEKLNAEGRALGLDTPDGAHALHKAARHQRQAATEYKKALKAFCDFILHGKPPEDASTHR